MHIEQDHARFRKIVRGRIRQNLRKYMAQGDLKAEAFPGSQEAPVSGVLAFIDNGIDANTGMVMLKAAFPNAEKTLWPGQFVNMVLT